MVEMQASGQLRYVIMETSVVMGAVRWQQMMRGGGAKYTGKLNQGKMLVVETQGTIKLSQ